MEGFDGIYMVKLLIKYSKLFCVLLSIIGSSLVFIAGSFSSSPNLEKIAEYASQVANNNTNGKSLFAFTVGQTAESGPIIDSGQEFHNLYGTFRQEKITFASIINADKGHNIVIDDDISDNLSMLYVGPVGAVSYKGHYKHYIYPVEIMFPDEKLYDISKYVVYISQTHADKILEKNGVSRQEDGTYSTDDYKSVQKQLITITTDGKESSFIVQNIYYNINYYYKGLHDVVGDFVMVSYYLPYNLRAEQKNMYFMSEYAYQNKYFMNYINSAYNSRKYLLKVNDFNISGTIDRDYLTSFYYSDFVNNDSAYALITVISCLFLLASFFFYFVERKYNQGSILYTFAHCLSLLIPYGIFALIYLLTGNVSFFSEISTKMNALLLIIYAILSVIIVFFLKWKAQRLLDRKENENEISI